MHKLIVTFLVLLLTGCGISSEGTGSNKDKNNKELSKMETLIKQEKYDEVFFNFRKNYSNKKPTQKEIELYNKVVVTIFKKNIEKYFSLYENLALKEYVNDKTESKLDDLTNKKIEDLKQELTSAIENKKYNKITEIDNVSDGLQKQDQELRAMTEYGLYLKTYHTEKSENRLFDSNGNLKIDSDGNIDDDYLYAIHRIQRNVPPSYTGKYSDEIREIALMKTPELLTSETSYLYTEKDWLKDYNFRNNIKMKNVEVGMTQEEVINQTDWGKPTDINTTITGSTKSEQWVYPDYKYLYFDNGILTSIQY